MAFVFLFGLAPREAQSHIVCVPLGAPCPCDCVLTLFLALTLTSLLLHYPVPSSIYFILSFCRRPLEKGGRHKGQKNRSLRMRSWDVPAIQVETRWGRSSSRETVRRGAEDKGELLVVLALQLASLGSGYWGL